MSLSSKSSDLGRLAAALCVGFAGLSLVACDTDNTPDSAEDIGESIDDAADDAADSMEDAADSIEDSVDDATDDTPPSP